MICGGRFLKRLIVFCSGWNTLVKFFSLNESSWYVSQKKCVKADFFFDVQFAVDLPHSLPRTANCLQISNLSLQNAAIGAASVQPGCDRAEPAASHSYAA